MLEKKRDNHEKAYGYINLILRGAEKLLGANFSVNGLENILSDDNDKQPILFVSNHFTRAETFFVPYIINKFSNRRPRSLAHGSLFSGALGNILDSLGALSTSNPNRDQIIINNLITAKDDWIIYPEGAMLKSKEIEKNKRFTNYTPERKGPTRTGSAVLAIKSEIYRDQIIEAFKNNDETSLGFFQKNFDVKYFKNLEKLNTKIVPLTVSYYPLRPGKNKIQNIAQRLMKKIPKEVIEELEIEGNLLLNAEININFLKPIDVSDYISGAKKTIYQIPIIKSETKSGLIIKYYRNKLTYDFMNKIYSNIQINFDHIFSATLLFLKNKTIDKDYLKRVIYLSASMIASRNKYNLNKSIDKSFLFKLFSDDSNKEFESVFELAKKQRIIQEVGKNKIKIVKDLRKNDYDFHQIRIENSLFVIANEFLLLQFASDIVKHNCKISNKLIKEKVFNDICKNDVFEYEKDYRKFFDEKYSKSEELGRPFFIKGRAGVTKKNVGIVICHGYKSSPKQVEALSKHLANLGFCIYAVRLKGHGTSPINIKDVSWKDWYNSIQKGYSAISNLCDKVIFIGFSTGGLLSLLSSSRKNNPKLFATVSINSALRLRDIRSKVVPGINIWNDLLDKFNIKSARFEYIDDIPENPEINYSRNYLNGVEELGKLMKICEKNLKNVLIPTLIIQGKNDNIVNPISAKIIYEKINSTNKSLKEMDFSNHSIITNARKEDVFKEIELFFKELKLIS